MDRRSALMWPPLMSWLMVTGSTRSTLTWSTHPGQGNSSQAFMSSCSWSTLVFLVQLADVDASLCFELIQVWREDLLCGGARQSEQTSGYWLGYVAVCLCLSLHLSVCLLTCPPAVCPQIHRCLSQRETRSPSERQDWSWVWSCLWLDSSTIGGRFEVTVASLLNDSPTPQLMVLSVYFQNSQTLWRHCKSYEKGKETHTSTRRWNDFLSLDIIIF